MLRALVNRSLHRHILDCHSASLYRGLVRASRSVSKGVAMPEKVPFGGKKEKPAGTAPAAAG